MNTSRHWGPMLRALAYNSRDYRFLIFATAVGFTVVAHALAVASLFKRAAGFETHMDYEHLAVAEVEAPADHEAVEQVIFSSPSVERIAWVSRHASSFEEFGEPVAPIDDVRSSVYSWPLPGDEHVIETLGLPMLAGRNYEATLAAEGDIEAVVTASLARAMSGKSPEEALGTRFVDGVKGRVMRIVGVVPDLTLQVSFVPDPMNGLFFYEPRVDGRRQFALIRLRDGGQTAIRELRELLRSKYGWADVTGGKELRQLPDVNTRGGKLVQIMVITAVLLVALIGNLGAASFSVAERTRHIGIRRALGATRYDIMSFFLDENFFLTTAGLLTGLPLTLGVAWIASRLEDHFALEWQHLALSAALFYVTGLLAAHVPALLAARVPPSTASRAV